MSNKKLTNTKQCEHSPPMRTLQIKNKTALPQQSTAFAFQIRDSQAKERHATLNPITN